jgi:hypothetical protein
MISGKARPRVHIATEKDCKSDTMSVITQC